MFSLQKLAIFLIKGYQYLISPLIGSSCRFTPTCSQYAILSIEKFGFFYGVWLSFIRVSRCHPLGGSGYDPVKKKKP